MAAAQSPELQHIKSRNRRRLIGAIAIVAALVVFLPMLLDKGPKPLKQDIAINIPAKEGEGFKPLNPPAKPVAEKKATDTKSTETKSTEPQEVPAAPSIDVKRGAPQTAANDVTQASGPGKNAVLKPMSKVLVPIDGTVVPAVVATPAPTPVPTPAPTPTPAPAKPAAPEKTPAGKFAGQIGVFSDPANAKEIQAKLAVKGFKSTAEKLADNKIGIRILG